MGVLQITHEKYLLCALIRKFVLIKANLLYSKTCLKLLLKIDKTKILLTNGNLMKVESIAEQSKTEHSAILLTCKK